MSGAPPPAVAVAATRPQTSADAGSEYPIVAQKESFLPGTEPHSPATWQNGPSTPSNGRVTTAGVGISSGVNLTSARLGPKGVLRVNVLAEYLNQKDFPVRNAQDIRSAIGFSVSFQPFEWGEAFVSYGASANTNNRTAPNLIQALGDLSLGIKASKEWVSGLHAGADLRLLTFSGVGNQGIDRFAFGFKPTIAVTYDVRSAAPSVPVIATMNLGFTLDSTGKLVTNQKLNASEEFALSTNKYNRFNFGIGVEVPLPWVTPFLDYSVAAPLGVPSTGLVGPDGVAVSTGSVMPQVLGLGLKVTAVKDLTLVAGVNIGLTRSVGLGVPATPPWNLLLGASFAIDPFQRGETKLVDTTREKRIEQKVAEAPKVARVEGTIVDMMTKKPIAGVVVTVGASLPSATDAQGRYTTLEVNEPKATLLVSRDGYKPYQQEVTLEPGKNVRVDLNLEEDAKKATFDVTVTSSKKGIKSMVVFDGLLKTALQTDDGATVPRTTEVVAGEYTVNVTADGYLAQTKEVQVSPGGKMALSFDLVPAPKKSLVVFKGDKIEILQQVHFATAKATILADSYNLLQQVVDAMVKNGVKRIVIEGHTDNRGDKAANQKLSEDRARAVADYMVSQGIEAKRVEAVGYGDTRPIAPNLTARGRELNRRVEFILPEK